LVGWTLVSDVCVTVSVTVVVPFGPVTVVVTVTVPDGLTDGLVVGVVLPDAVLVGRLTTQPASKMARPAGQFFPP
jgi:hypothetical protein